MSKWCVIVSAIGLTGTLLIAVSLIVYLAIVHNYWILLTVFPLVVIGVGITKLIQLGWDMAVEDSQRRRDP